MSVPRAGGPRTERQTRDGDWRASPSERKKLGAAVSDETIQALRRRIGELDQLARQLDQSGLNNARAQLLLSRKRAELEDFINRGQRCQHRSDGTTTTRTIHHG